MFVRRPCPHGPNVLLGLDVREPGLLHQCFENGSGAWVEAAFSGRHEEQFVEVFGGVVRGEGVVRGLPFHVEVNVFDPSAWPGVPDEDGKSVNVVPVCDLTVERTTQELHTLLISPVVQHVSWAMGDGR